MNRWFHHFPRTPHFRPQLVLAVAACLLTLAARPAPAAPEYALSGQADALAGSVLAQTPAGPVTALDVLMLDAMRDRTLATIPLMAWLNPGALEATPFRPAIRAGVERLLAYQSLARKAGDWQPPADDLRVKSFGAAMAVWIEKVVKPQVKVMEITDPASGRVSGDIDRYYLAHPEKYLRRLSAEVRYIFMAANMSDPEDKLKVRQRLEAVAKQVQDGKIDFPQAARQLSQAPSAAQGGLLPPFYNNTFFPEFDTQTFQLDKPGRVTPVFEGPEGLYLVQLVRTFPPRNIPITEVREEIRQTLALDHVRHYYAYLLAKLARKRYVQNYAAHWNYLNLNAPIVQVNNIALSRPDFLRYFANPIGPSYETRLPGIIQDAGYWVEGEILLADLSARGLTGHPWIARARELAVLALKVDQAYIAQVPATAYAAGEAMTTIRNNKQFIQGLRSAHLIEIDVQLKDAKSEKSAGGLLGVPRPLASPSAPDTGAQQEAMGLQNAIAAHLTQGVLPIEPTPVNLSEWATRVSGRQDRLASELETLQSVIDNAPWPGVRIRLKDQDWVDVVPGTPWYDLLKNVGIGKVSNPIKVGANSTQFLVLAERPVDLTAWETKPLLIRALAFQIEASKLFHGEVLRVRQASDVTYTFQ